MRLAKKIICMGIVCLIVTTTSMAYSRQLDQDRDSRSNTTVPVYVYGNSGDPTLEAIRINDENPIVIDGKLDEPYWSRTPVATGFTQRDPDDGSPATEQTEVRVLYSDDAIYFGFTAYDTSPDSIASTLFRRDGDDYSDWVIVSVDSYNDNRTAFTFGVNPRGVQKDVLIFDDSNTDELWNAVWEASTEIHDNGWVAEIRIPLSQLRYSGRESIQNWDINFWRIIARHKEESYWSPTPQDASGKVSQFGSLTGISNLDEPLRLEITPYISQNLIREPDQPGNPYFKTNNFSTRFGGDIKYGVTPDLTLTATINPDFGQVEADPATINLSAFQTFFQERRPFFLEGNEIFNFGRTRTYNTFGNPLTFYSRRIGRAPQGSFSGYNNSLAESLVNDGDEIHVDNPPQTTIYGAAKLSGKTRGGWSIGLLNAVTGVEKGRYSIITDGSTREDKYIVEPAANYFVNRLKKDINDGNSTFGTFISAVHRRDLEGSYLEDVLQQSAYLTGVDFEHNFSDRDYIISGVFSYSRINGSKESISRVQQSSARYYQRVDSGRLSLDAERTHLDGIATELSFQKQGGEHTRFSVTYSDVTPGYEVNDLGFENRADYRALSLGSIYREPDPKRLRFWELWSFQMFAWNYDGDNIEQAYNVGGFFELANLWSFNMNVNTQPFSAYNDRLTRGGPVAMKPGFFNFNFNINSDQTKKLSFNVGNFHRWEFKNDEYDHYYWFGLTYRPTSFISFQLNPEIGFEKDIDQYITTVDDETAVDTFGHRYVFAEIESVNFFLPVRLNWTFSPVMSLQTYIRPFISTGKFVRYKEFARPRSFDFHVYGQDTGTFSEDSEGEITIDPDNSSGPASSFVIQRPDFSFRSVQTNAVFRWEFRPGSVLYLVWQQQRQGSEANGQFNFRDDFSGIFDVDPTNIFLVKLSYWIGS